MEIKVPDVREDGEDSGDVLWSEIVMERKTEQASWH